MAICAFGIIKNQDDKILLVQIAPPFAESNKWNFPGGVMYDDEKISDGLAREVTEETSIECAVLVKVDTFITPNGIDEINIYYASYVSGEIIIQKSEIIQARWFSTTAALKLDLAFNIRSYISALNF
jgi:8-oxo-dGTP pyrophosphatase MutT (NUDIX family)